MPRLNQHNKYNVEVKGENGDAKQGIVSYDAKEGGFRLKQKNGKNLIDGTFSSLKEMQETSGYRIKTTGVAA